MRELKFRAWDKIDHKYREPMLYDILYEKIVVRFPIETLKKGEFLLEQYTGFKDKNGEEICEGDIVNYDDYENYAVEQSKSGAWTIGKTELFGLAPYCEVIGNIHENPELLEGE